MIMIMRRGFLLACFLSAVVLTHFGTAAASTQLNMACGSVHTVLINSDGTLFAWGANNFGQLGNDTTVNGTVPVQIGSDSDWSAIAPGRQHTLALKTDGTLWAWGSNENGQLGDPTIVGTSLVPVQIGSDTSWASVAAGSSHSVALKKDGTIWAWGDYSYRMVGIYVEAINSPTPIQIGTDADWVYINANGNRTFAIKSNGALWGWGWIEYGVPTYHGWDYHPDPFQLGSDSDWQSISAGGSHQVALKRDGTLWAWGDNSYGQVGNNSTTHAYLPVQIGIDAWRSVSAGGVNSYAIRSDGTLWAWGANYYGQLGNGTILPSSGPGSTVPIQIGSQSDWSLVDGGNNNYAMGLRSDGSLWGWGSNGRGEAGYGHAIVLSSPVQVSLHPVDTDGDGWYSFEDCNDAVNSIHPGAPEIKYDGIDQDCNGYDLTITVTKAVTTIVKNKPVTMHVEATSALRADAGLYWSLSPSLTWYFTWEPRKKVWVMDTDVSYTDPIVICGIEGCDYPAPVTVRTR